MLGALVASAAPVRGGGCPSSVGWRGPADPRRPGDLRWPAVAAARLGARRGAARRQLLAALPGGLVPGLVLLRGRGCAAQGSMPAPPSCSPTPPRSSPLWWRSGTSSRCRSAGPRLRSSTTSERSPPGETRHRRVRQHQHHPPRPESRRSTSTCRGHPGVRVATPSSPSSRRSWPATTHLPGHGRRHLPRHLGVSTGARRTRSCGTGTSSPPTPARSRSSGWPGERPTGGPAGGLHSRPCSSGPWSSASRTTRSSASCSGPGSRCSSCGGTRVLARLASVPDLHGRLLVLPRARRRDLHRRPVRLHRALRPVAGRRPRRRPHAHRRAPGRLVRRAVPQAGRPALVGPAPRRGVRLPLLRRRAPGAHARCVAERRGTPGCAAG